MKLFGVFEKLRIPATEEVTENQGTLPEGITKDDDGKLINEEGYLVDEDGTLVDEEGNPIEAGDEEEEEEEEVSQSPAEVAQALEIFKALNNKDTAPAMMAFLNAKLAQNGLAPVTNKELAEVSLEDILKEGFGEDYAFLHEKLSPALSKAINTAVSKSLGPQLEELKTNNQRLQEEIASTKISAALDPIIEEMGADEFDKIASDLSKTMATYPNTANLPLKVYIKNMITLVENGKQAPNRVAKNQKNVREAKRNLSTGVRPSSVKIGKTLPTHREAIIAATKGIKFED